MLKHRKVVKMEKNSQLAAFGIVEKSAEHIVRFTQMSNFSKTAKNLENSKKAEKTGAKLK